MDEIIGSLKYLAEKKAINVSFEHNSAIEIFADQEMISTVIRNLFSNAIKFTPEGKSITVGLKKQENLVEIWVEDEGIGIPKEKINELFFQVYFNQ